LLARLVINSFSKFRETTLQEFDTLSDVSERHALLTHLHRSGSHCRIAVALDFWAVLLGSRARDCTARGCTVRYMSLMRSDLVQLQPSLRRSLSTDKFDKIISSQFHV
jgi:hypothetical protein